MNIVDHVADASKTMVAKDNQGKPMIWSNIDWDVLYWLDAIMVNSKYAKNSFLNADNDKEFCDAIGRHLGLIQKEDYAFDSGYLHLQHILVNAYMALKVAKKNGKSFRADHVPDASKMVGTESEVKNGIREN